MAYIKKLVIDGFKSFGKKTEIILSDGLNVIVGPNGSGKSNIIDAICFVLGRLAMKSLRADSAQSLLFKGSKNVGGSDRAHLQLVFNNHDKSFVIDNETPEEVVIERILKEDGSSIYKINGKTKTRSEILELLTQAHLSPYGFNLIQQREIVKFVEMRGEERRRLIEDIAGISVYEERKERALRELEKTEEKIREIRAISSEKEHFLKNLEAERKQALFYNQIKQHLENLKYSIVERKLSEKTNEKEKLLNLLRKEESKRNAKEQEQKRLKENIEQIKKEIESIDSYIESISGVELKEMQASILELKTQVTKLEMKRSSLKTQLASADEKIKKLREEIELSLKDLSELKRRQKERLAEDENKKLESSEKKIDETRKRYSYLTKRLETLEANARELVLSKERLTFLNKNFLTLSEEITKKKASLTELKSKLNVVNKGIGSELQNLQKKFEENNNTLQEKEKLIASLLREKELYMKEWQDLQELKICPKCKRELEDEHKKKLEHEYNEKIKNIEVKEKNALAEIKVLTAENKNLQIKILDIMKEKEKEDAKEKENELINYKIKELKSQIENLLKEKKEIVSKIETLNKKISELEADVGGKDLIEEEFSEIKSKLNSYLLEKEKIKQKLDFDKQLTLDVELKEREIENAQDVLTRTEKEKAKAEENLKNVEDELQEISALLKEKQEKYDEIYKKFSNLIEKKKILHEEIIKTEARSSSLHSEIFIIDNKINEMNINLAKYDAELKALEEEMKEFTGKELRKIKLPLEKLEEKFQKTKIKLEEFGNVNLLALETYEKVKKEYEEVNEKLNKIILEKQEIINQIEKINKEKRKVFLTTFEKINSEFNTNFSKLDWKGREAKLVLEDEKNIFEKGVDVIIQVGRKQFDSMSFSGGEKVLVALSFIFAIQKLSPYPFYIFDEIDAELDKHNSERVANLLKEHIGNSQCIIVSHNDATISKGDLIYGVSMQDGVSKVISLKL